MHIHIVPDETEKTQGVQEAVFENAKQIVIIGLDQPADGPPMPIRFVMGDIHALIGSLQEMISRLESQLIGSTFIQCMKQQNEAAHTAQMVNKLNLNRRF